MIAQKLKEQTSAYHDAIEKLTNSHKIFDNTFSGEDYKNLLQVNAAVVNGFMDEIAQQLPAELKQQINFDGAAKVAAIQADAQDLSISLLNDKESLKETNPAFALGALYVMEGSMLGGSVIAKTLRKGGNFEEHPFNYFTFHKENLGPSWKNFVTILNETVVDEKDQESCVNGAVQVYEHLIESAKKIFAN